MKTALYICILLILSLCAHGQRGPISLVLVSVQQPIINTNYGERVAIGLLKKQKLPQDLYVRVFRGTKKSLEQFAAQATDSCVEYYSVVLLPRARGSVASIPLDGWTDDRWLRPNGTGFSDEDWVLVFESGTNPDKKFRIERQDASKYFDSGVELHLLAPSYLQANVAQRVSNALQSHATQVAILSDSAPGPCYKIEATENLQATVLVPRTCRIPLNDKLVLYKHVRNLSPAYFEALSARLKLVS